MIVCVCHRISDREIRRIAQQGCESFDDLQIDSRVATCCGRCEACAREVFAQAQAAQGSVAAIHPPVSFAKSVR
ncbi:MAG TPA: (2Fe-2S)-binding protein [Aquabacterium sp.]|nr:(2Fe-2S)-binding protein [Aquabacterium sp.]